MLSGKQDQSLWKGQAALCELRASQGLVTGVTPPLVLRLAA